MRFVATRGQSIARTSIGRSIHFCNSNTPKTRNHSFKLSQTVVPSTSLLYQFFGIRINTFRMKNTIDVTGCRNAKTRCDDCQTNSPVVPGATVESTACPGFRLIKRNIHCV